MARWTLEEDGLVHSCSGLRNDVDELARKLGRSREAITRRKSDLRKAYAGQKVYRERTKRRLKFSDLFG